MSQNTPETIRLTGNSAVCSTDLFSALCRELCFIFGDYGYEFPFISYVDGGVEQSICVVRTSPSNQLTETRQVCDGQLLERSILEPDRLLLSRARRVRGMPLLRAVAHKLEAAVLPVVRATSQYANNRDMPVKRRVAFGPRFRWRSQWWLYRQLVLSFGSNRAARHPGERLPLPPL